MRGMLLSGGLTYGQDPNGVDGELVGLCVTHLGRLFFDFKKWSGEDGCNWVVKKVRWLKR